MPLAPNLTADSESSNPAMAIWQALFALRLARRNHPLQRIAA